MLRILYDDFDQKVKNIHDEMDLHHSYEKQACISSPIYKQVVACIQCFILFSCFSTFSITYIPVALIGKKKEEAALKPPQDQLAAGPPQTSSLNVPASSALQPAHTLSPMPSYNMSDPRAVDIVRHPEFG